METILAILYWFLPILVYILFFAYMVYTTSDDDNDNYKN
jgi:hypothetical protein